MDIVKTHRVHGGTLSYATHDSAATGTPMRLSIFVPPGAGPFPVVIWLSGLTCTEDNFTTKAGAYEAAARLGLIVVAPDTSPRGDGVADDEAYDLGQGAGFYVDATEAPWAPHFCMETYVTRDLVELIDAQFPTTGRRAIAGHSMGGRVALEVVRQAPERVTHLGLLDTGYRARAAGAAGDDEATKRHALLDIARRDGVAAMAREWVQGMVAPARLQDQALIDDIIAMFARRSATIFANQIKALLERPDASGVLASLQVPTLLLCGREDSWSPPVQHEEMLRLAGDVASFVVVEHAGHMSTQERPAEVAAAMRSWLAR